MIDAWRALPQGRNAILQVLPTTFNWPLFWMALVLMASPVLHHVAFLIGGLKPRATSGAG